MKIKPAGGLLSWANSHPTITTLLTLLLFAAVPLAINSNEKLADNPYAWAIGGLLVFVIGGAWCVVLRRHSKHLITAFLVVDFLASAVQPAKPAGYAAGVAVLCVGAYCVYKMVKTCQRVFPPKSKDTNSNGGFSATGTDEYAGCFEYSSIGSCYVPSGNEFRAAVDTVQATTFDLNVIVEPYGTTCSMTAHKEEAPQTWAEFQADMATHGLFMTGHPSPVPQFSRNGVPCDESAVPLWFDPVTGAVTQRSGGDMRRVVVERSVDLVTWSPLLQTDVSVGNGFKVEDTTAEGSMFYRVQVSQP